MGEHEIGRDRIAGRGARERRETEWQEKEKEVLNVYCVQGMKKIVLFFF